MLFRVLGPLEVTEGDGALDIGAPKQRAVLAMLLIDANRVVPVDRLIDRLWGDDPPARAMGSLQAYVSNLRRVLEPGRAAREAGRRIATRPPGYVLSVDAGECDAVTFERDAAVARALAGGGDHVAALAAFDDCLSLWRGTAYLEFADEPFAITERSRLDELRLLALEDRIASALALGRHAEAVPTLETLTADQPYRERLWELRMLALYRAGRQAEALQCFRQVERNLVEGLGLSPGGRLVTIEAQILAHAPELDWSPSATPATTAPARITPRPAEGVEITSVVGRDRELAAMTEAVEAAAAAGRATTILVAGEAGIGKTRLIDAACELAAAGGFRVARGACLEGAGSPAFWAWRGVVSALSVGAARQRPALAHLLGDYDGEAGDRRPVLDAERARFDLFEAVAELVAEVAQQAPLLLAIDDVHWADASSLQLLTFVTGHVRAAPLLVAVSLRDEPGEDPEPLVAALAALARQGAQRLALSGLDVAGTRDLVSTTAGIEAPSDVATMVHARSGGNPFFVTELTRLLLSEGAFADAASVATRSVPVAVRDVIRRRLARLPDTARAFLQVGAVAGREFEVEIVEGAAELDDEQTLGAVEAATITGLLVDDAQRVGRYRFAHALVQEAILDDISPLRRARMHARVGRALEASPLADPMTRSIELAHHYFEGAPAGTAEPAFEYAMLAADETAARLGYEQTRALLERALELVPRLPAGEARDARELRALVRLSLHLNMTDGYTAPGIEAACARAEELCRIQDDRQSLLPTLWLLSAFRNVRGEHRAAESLARQLLAAAGDDPAFAVVGHGAMGLALSHLGDLPGGITEYEQALERCTPDLHEPLARILNHHPLALYRCDLAIVLALAGESQRAHDLCESAVALATEIGHPYGLAHALCFHAWVCALEQDAGRVAALVAQGLPIADNAGYPLYVAWLRGFGGWAAVVAGGNAKGIDELKYAAERIDALGTRLVLPLLYALLADAYLCSGLAGEAAATAAAGLVIAGGGSAMHASMLLRAQATALNDERLLREAFDVASAQGAALLEAQAASQLEQ